MTKRHRKICKRDYSLGIYAKRKRTNVSKPKRNVNALRFDQLLQAANRAEYMNRVTHCTKILSHDADQLLECSDRLTNSLTEARMESANDLVLSSEPKKDRKEQEEDRKEQEEEEKKKQVAQSSELKNVPLIDKQKEHKHKQRSHCCWNWFK